MMKEHNEQQAEDIQYVAKCLELDMCTEGEARDRVKEICERPVAHPQDNFSELTKTIIDKHGDWPTLHFRGEWIAILRQIISNDFEYSAHINSLIYSYWKFEQSQRVMSSDSPEPAEYFSRENAWEVLNSLNLRTIEFPQELTEWISTEADWI